MAICDTCGHEYLDSYDTCPFCRRAEQAEAAGRPDDLAIPQALPAKDRRLTVGVGFGVAGAAVVLLVWGVMAAVTYSVGTSTADRMACASQQVAVERAALVWSAEHDEAPLTDISAISPEYVYRLEECPSGGAYTFEWDPAIPKYSCSVHGWHVDEGL